MPPKSSCFPTEALIVCLLMSTCSAQAYDNSNIKEEIGLSTSGVLRLRNYTAIDHYLVTKDGYILNLIEASNPLIDYNGDSSLSSKEVVLLIHGTVYNATCYITDTHGASPIDYSGKNASQLSQAELEQLYSGNPNSESLALMLLDFGHKVFLLNRRGTVNSQGHVNRKGSQSQSPASDLALKTDKNLTDRTIFSFVTNNLSAYFADLAKTVDSKYWNFSLDEEAKYDLPVCFDFILEQTNRSSLAVVGWSSGAAIIEMALIEHPDLNEKISKALLWAPALYLGRPLRNKLSVIVHPILDAYIGPILPQFIDNIIGFGATSLCTTQVTQRFLCQTILDLIAGFGGDKERVKPGFFNSFFAPISSHHAAQLAQATFKGKMHHYDYGLIKNLAVYGAPQPPIYNVSKITSKGLYFWGAAYDGLVDIDDVQDNVNDLSVSATFLRLNQPGIFFNHYSFAFHKDKSELLLKPSLKILES